MRLLKDLTTEELHNICNSQKSCKQCKIKILCFNEEFNTNALIDYESNKKALKEKFERLNQELEDIYNRNIYE